MLNACSTGYAEQSTIEYGKLYTECSIQYNYKKTTEISKNDRTTCRQCMYNSHVLQQT